jgi:hypothetical protein
MLTPEQMRASPEYCMAAIATLDKLSERKDLHPAVAIFYDKAKVGYKRRMLAAMYGG